MCPLVLLDSDRSTNTVSREKQHLRFLEEAAELEVETVVVITGGLPPDSRDIAGQRQKVVEELEQLIPIAKKNRSETGAGTSAPHGLRHAVSCLEPC